MTVSIRLIVAFRNKNIQNRAREYWMHVKIRSENILFSIEVLSNNYGRLNHFHILAWYAELNCLTWHVRPTLNGLRQICCTTKWNQVIQNRLWIPYLQQTQNQIMVVFETTHRPPHTKLSRNVLHIFRCHMSSYSCKTKVTTKTTCYSTSMWKMIHISYWHVLHDKYPQIKNFIQLNCKDKGHFQQRSFCIAHLLSFRP